MHMNAIKNVTLDMLYAKLMSIERDVNEISEDLHRVKPEFAEKLGEIEKEKTHSFRSLEEMEAKMDRE